MANDFYNHGGYPSTGSAGASSSARAEFDAIMAGFDKMPPLAGNASKLVAINAGATGLTAVTSIDATPIGAVTPSTGAFTTLSATGNVTLGDAVADTLSVGGSTIKNATGNWSIPAPSAGSTFSVAALAGGAALATSSSGAYTVLSFTDGTRVGLITTNATYGTLYGTTSAHGAALLTNNTARLEVASGGNVTINAPAAADPSLTVNVRTGGQNGINVVSGGAIGDYALQVFTGSATTGFVGVGNSTVGNASLRNAFGIGTQTNHDAVVLTNNSEVARFKPTGVMELAVAGAALNFTNTGATVAQINYFGTNNLELVPRNAAAGVKIYYGNAAGPALSIGSAAGAATFINSVTATRVIQNAPSAASNFMEWQNAGVTVGYMGDRTGVLGAGTGLSIRSEGQFSLGTNGATERLSISTTGNVVLNGATSGATFGVNSAVGGGLAASATARLFITAGLVNGRLTSDAGNELVAIHSFFDATVLELSAASTAANKAGVVIRGAGASTSPSTVSFWTADTKRVEITAAGAMTIASQIGAKVRSGTGTGGAGSTEVTTYASTDWNVGGFMNASTGRFTPTVAGKYLVIGSSSWATGGSAAVCGCSVRKNGAVIADQLNYASNGISGQVATASAIIDLNGSTDYVSLFVTNSGAVASNTGILFEVQLLS